eukprot:TRINITY_DN30649_c0_g1_i1.p1 TRINITY_DN30649_c0_g1~~TRINITY_DN30649_c0_g1_i1.p1  ORF type:complete len:395 (+),score=72.57 TRINITY_DN30649_c0_g1_i1:2-1186(+)
MEDDSSDPFSVDFCTKNPLLKVVPTTISTINLDRVISYLLEQVVAQQESAKLSQARQDQQQKEIQAIHLIINDIKLSIQNINIRTETQDKEINQSKIVQNNFSDQLTKATNSIDSVTTAVEGLRATTEEQENIAKSYRENIDQLRDQLYIVITDQQEISSTIKEMETTTQTTPVVQDDLHKTIDALRSTISENNEETDVRIQKIESKATHDKGELIGKIETDAMELEKLGKLLLKEASARKHLEEKIDEIHSANFASSLENLAMGLLDLGNCSREHQLETKTGIDLLGERVSEDSKKLASITKQLQLKGGFLDESDETSGSILSLLGDKISDILSVLILFENKVQKNEEDLARLEDHLIETLKHLDGEEAAVYWKKKKSVENPSQRAGCGPRAP